MEGRYIDKNDTGANFIRALVVYYWKTMSFQKFRKTPHSVYPAQLRSRTFMYTVALTFCFSLKYILGLKCEILLTANVFEIC